MIQWRLLETAPMNGVVVLLGSLQGEGEHGRVCLGRWEPYEAYQGPEDVDGRWMMLRDTDGALVECLWTPTHFCLWTPPRTMAEIEEMVARDTRRRYDQPEYDKLVRFLVKCCYFYHVRREPLVSDLVYDATLLRVQDLEVAGYVEIREHSPGRRILGTLESDYPEWAKERS